MPVNCEIKGCKRKASITYLGKRICDKHWRSHCEGRINLKELNQSLKDFI